MCQKENVFIIKKERNMAKLSRLAACVVVTKLIDGHKLIWNIALFSKNPNWNRCNNEAKVSDQV